MAYEITNLFRIKNNTSENIAAFSFAKLDGYDTYSHYFKVKKPDADNLPLSQIVIVPELVYAGKIGLAYFDGICVVKKTTGSITAGDKVGTDNNQWTAIEISDDSLGNNDGQFLVLDTYDTDKLIIRPRTRESIMAYD